MIKVYLKDGQEVTIDKGMSAYYQKVMRDVKAEEEVGTVLEVRNSGTFYSGKVIASFKADEVLYFTNETEEGE